MFTVVEAMHDRESTSNEHPERLVEERLAILRERGRQRFVWQADAQGRFTFVSATLADVVGAGCAAILGLTWDEIVGRLVVDDGQAVARLFAARETWSGRTVLWRIEGTEYGVAVDLAGIPTVGAERELLGFRGFGVCRTDAIQPLGSSEGLGPESPDEAEPAGATADAFPPEGVAAALPARVDDGECAQSAAGAAMSPMVTAPEQPSKPEPESGMQAHVGHAATPPSFTTLTASAGARLGLPRPVPLRAVGRDGAPASRPAQRKRLEVAPSFPQGGRLSPEERQAFREIARALSEGARDASPASAEPDGAVLQRNVEASDDARDRLSELADILDTVTDGIVVIDADARILSVNRSAEALFGLDGSELVGSPVGRLLASKAHADFMDQIAALRRGDVGGLLSQGYVLEGRVRQGGTFPLAVTVGRIGHSGERFCLLLRDLTSDLRRDGAGADSAADARGREADLLAKISHEVRTPLNTMIGFAEIMLERRLGPLGNDRYRGYMEDIHKSGYHVLALIDGLLDLARIEAGRGEFSFAELNINELVATCAASSQEPARRGRIVMRTSFQPSMPRVIADEGSIRRIVANLLANAVGFTEPGGQVIISTAMTEQGEVALRVRDTGLGMSREKVAAALQPFRHVGSRHGGLGLGLPLAKALADANGAALQISSSVGKGTLVEVLFPRKRVLAH